MRACTLLLLALGSATTTAFVVGRPTAAFVSSIVVDCSRGFQAATQTRDHVGMGKSLMMSEHAMTENRILDRRAVLLMPAAFILCASPLRANAEADALKKDMIKLKVGLKVSHAHPFRRTRISS